MKHILLILTSLFTSLSLYSQSDTLLFSTAIKINFKKYRKESAQAYRKGDFARGSYLFDSLVDHRLAGTTFDNYTLKRAKGGKFHFNKTKKPVLLITYASWCVINKGEIKALNNLAKKYSKNVEFVILFWDRKHNISKISRKFNSKITVCYAHEYYRSDAPIVAALKHTLGFPTSFYLDESLRVVDVRRCGIKLLPLKVNEQKSYTLNYNNFLEGLDALINDNSTNKEMPAD